VHLGLSLRRPRRLTGPGAHRRPPGRLGLVVVALTAALVAASCGSAPPGRLVDEGVLPDGAPLTIPVDAGYNAVDVTEMVTLLVRHERRRPLLESMVARSDDPEVREVARRVLADAETGDAVAFELLERWGQPTSTELGGGDGLAVGTAALEGMGPAEFDRAALELLLLELQADVVDGAVARNDGRDDTARRLGNDTVERAQLRILRVKELLGEP
jgi:hypothetical protein